MIQARIIPCLLLKNKGLIKTYKFKESRYIGDPINAVKIFNEKEVDEIVLIDIEASKNNRKPDFNLISRIGKEAFMPMVYGGGIKTIEDAKKVLSSGFEKISLNSLILNNKNAISEFSKYFGSQSIIVSIDVKKNINGKYEVYDYLSGKSIKKNPIEYAIESEEKGAGELLINSVDKDGTMEGYDLELIHKISYNTTIPVIALGGAGSLFDFKQIINEGGASAASAGSMFVFQGKHKAVLINYPNRKEIDDIIINKHDNKEINV